jgi:hypothetical protein
MAGGKEAAASAFRTAAAVRAAAGCIICIQALLLFERPCAVVIIWVSSSVSSNSRVECGFKHVLQLLVSALLLQS